MTQVSAGDVLTLVLGQVLRATMDGTAGAETGGVGRGTGRAEPQGFATVIRTRERCVNSTRPLRESSVERTGATGARG